MSQIGYQERKIGEVNPTGDIDICLRKAGERRSWHYRQITYQERQVGEIRRFYNAIIDIAGGSDTATDNIA